MTPTDLACIGRLARTTTCEVAGRQEGETALIMLSGSDIRDDQIGERLIRELDHAGYRVVRVQSAVAPLVPAGAVPIPVTGVLLDVAAPRACRWCGIPVPVYLPGEHHRPCEEFDYMGMPEGEPIVYCEPAP
jgi:hypothetical protein